MDIQFLDVIPLIACEDIAVTHDFLVDALGFVSAGLERDGTGQVVHGEVRAGDRRIWLHMTTAEAGLATPTTLGGSGGGNVIQVVDVDAHFERAGARPARPSSRSPPTRTTGNASTACVIPTATAGGSPPRPRHPPPADGNFCWSARRFGRMVPIPRPTAARGGEGHAERLQEHAGRSCWTVLRQGRRPGQELQVFAKDQLDDGSQTLFEITAGSETRTTSSMRPLAPIANQRTVPGRLARTTG